MGSVTNLSFSLLEGLDTRQVSPYKGTLSARFHMDGVGIIPLVGDLGDWQFDGMCSLGVAWSHRETRPVLAVRVMVAHKCLLGSHLEGIVRIGMVVGRVGQSTTAGSGSAIPCLSRTFARGRVLGTEVRALAGTGILCGVFWEAPGGTRTAASEPGWRGTDPDRILPAGN